METFRRLIVFGPALLQHWFSSLLRSLLSACVRPLRSGALALLLAVALLVSGNSSLVLGVGLGSLATALAASSQGTPHHFDPKNGTTSVLHAPLPSHLPNTTPLTQRPPMNRAFVPTMKDGLLQLDPNTSTRFVGSDGRLEIDVPAGAVTAADVTAAGGKLFLHITEIAPPSGSNAGGAAISLGSYLVEVVDGKNHRFAHGLRNDAVLLLHYGTKGSAVDLDQAFVVFNGAHPSTLTGLGPYSTQSVIHDRQHHVLLAHLPADPTVSVSAATPPAFTGGAGGPRGVGGFMPALPLAQQTPLTSFTFDTYPPVAKFGSPDPLNVDLNAGSLTNGLKLDVPPGPAGAMPNITLAYNSAAVSEQHSPQGAAGWVGEGWSLSLGSISWAEHNVHPQCTNCGNTWQNSWQLTDPFGTSTELIPPNITTSTYYDDTPNWYCATGNQSSTACPIQFHTARESHAKVYAYVGPNALGNMPQNPPCFRVYLDNGVMEEFGCTADSLQYYPIQSGSLPGQTNSNVLYPVNWLLDLITNAQGDQIHVTYQSDTATAPNGVSYPRDTVMATIEWDSPNCVNASQRCTGTAAPNQWQPLYRVNFAASHHTVSRLTNTPANCNTDTTVRCDDPISVSRGIAAPLVNGTFVLNDIQVQTNPTADGSSYSATSWNTVRDYQLSYEQSGPTTITDPATGMQVSTAGYFDLTQLKEVGTDGTTAYPPTAFSYTSQTEYYEDGSFTPYHTNFCGPSWNTGGNGGTCDLWSQSRDGNSRYLASVSNGQGLQETFTWANARSNTHGVNSGVGTDIANPLYCNTHQTGYPCNSADDQAWSRIVVTQRSSSVVQLTQQGQGGTQTSTPVTSTWGYTYQLSYPLAAQECLDCVAGMYWGNQNDGDYLDYYNGHFMGFAQTSVSNPDGSVVTHKYEATEGWGVYDTTQGISCAASSLPPISTTCHAAPWWHVANAGHGLETEADSYDTNGTTLLKKVSSQYQAVCPPSGVSGTPNDPTYGTWDGNLVSMLDHNNPVAACDVQKTQQITTTLDGAGNSITDTEAYTYDTTYGRLIQTTSTSNSGGGSGGSASPTTIVHKSSYVWNDGLTVPAAQRSNASQEAAWGGTYVISTTASTDTEDSGGTQYKCHQTSYDGQAYTTGQTSTLTTVNPTEQDDFATSCGATPSGKLSTTGSYDAYGNLVSAKDPEANNGNASHLGATGTACANTTACVQYDGTNQARATLGGNAANQNTTAGYNAATDPAAGYGLWRTSLTDANNQQTTYTYDALGRQTSTRSPGQSSGPATQSTTYTTWCSGTSAQSPCVEVDTTQRVTSTTTVTTRKFYDGAGRLVETRAPAPGGQDVVQFTLYNVAGNPSTQSVQYFVAAYTGASGSAAYSIPDSTQVATTTTYDGLSRTVQVTDPLSNVTRTAYSIVCNAPGASGDTGCYEQTLSIDANNHEQGVLTDGFGRQIYTQRYTGNSAGTYALYSTTKNTYDYTGHVTQVLHPDGIHTTTSTYDTAGRLVTLSDPDRGVATYSYDSNGNRTQQIDARCGTTLPQTACSAGTIYTGYDGLNRPIWRNNTNSSTGAYVTYSYDSTAGGNNGVGHLTGETFNGGVGSGNLGAGAYTYTYDALGRKTGWSVTLGGNTYTFSYGYNDANAPTSLTYSDGEQLSYGYDSTSDWLTSLVTTPSGGSATNLLTAISYSGAGGAGGLPTGANVANGTYTYSASYDAALRLTTRSLAQGATTKYSSTRTYDAVGNVTSVNTTLVAGTDNQAFCYDEQNRLTWASSASGSISCGGTLTAGTLTAAQYGATSFTFDTLDRQSAENSTTFTYGNSAHLHAITSLSSGYSAAFDQAGNMTCRAPNGSTACSGTQTGEQLTYDNEGRLTAWQNAPSNPTSTEVMAYDGEGQRVALKINGGTPTYYLGTLEEITGSTLTKYLCSCALGQAENSTLPTAVRVGTGGTLSYLARDGLGSLAETFDGSGNVSFQQLYNPYGGIRYTNGTPPTTRFFTGQVWDSVAGLAYYVARYYNPTPHQFISADTVQDGLNRYAYVHANPETYTDPTGHWWIGWHWWGFTIHLNGSEATDLAYTMAFVAGIGLVGGWVLGFIAFIIGLTALGIAVAAVFGGFALLVEGLGAFSGYDAGAIFWLNRIGGNRGIWIDFYWWTFISGWTYAGCASCWWSVPFWMPIV